MKGPLDGIRIVDLTTMASGPWATTILGDQGADVIKVEGPGREDTMRRIGPQRGGLSGVFTNLNRNKRSIVLALKDPRGAAILDELVADADVFIQNFRPGAIDRLGFGAERLRERHPDLVYVSMSGFGERGPMADQPVYDSVMQAYSGFVAHQADPKTGEPAFVRNIICDKGTAAQTAQLITSALLARERGAGGQHLRISMLHASINFLWPDGMQNYTLVGGGTTAPLARSSLPAIKATRDGFISISYIQDHEFAAACEALALPELARDERFEKAGNRAGNLDALDVLLAPVLSSLTTEELVAKLEAARVPHAVVRELETLHEDPQVIANELLFEMDHPTAGRIRQPRPLGDFETSPASVRRPAPLLGEHSDEILRELGRSEDEITMLRDEGVLV